MTTGERIQFNRKRLGMSQEQLGQKLLVSRQTVSLWEKDQTLPTVDNLTRLSEIFGISVDEMLFETEQKADGEPLEKYEYKISEAELKGVFGATNSFGLVHLIAFAVLFALCFAVFAMVGFTAFAWVMLGVAVMYLVVGAIIVVSNRKLRKMSSESVLKTDYKCLVYDDRFELVFYENGSQIGSHVYNFSKLGEVRETAGFFLVRNLNQFYMIPKKVLAADSRLRVALSARVNELTYKKPEKGLRLVSNLLVFAAAASVIAAFSLIVFNALNGGSGFSALPLLFLPVPAASLLFGVYLMKRRLAFKPNLFVGGLCLVIIVTLSIVGVNRTKSPEPFSSGLYYEYVEECLGADFPEPDEINFVDNGSMEQPDGDSWVYSMGMVRFSGKNADRMKSLVKSDKRWLTKIPKELKNAQPPYFKPEYDYVIFYDIINEAYNSVPDLSGSYECIAAYYSEEDATLYTFDYDVDVE